jgi:hypothetical protein
MGNIYRSAMGKPIDIDIIRMANEQTMAIGNMKVNARGDQLGPGGKIVKTRAQIMAEYHQLNSPIAHDDPVNTELVADTIAQPVSAQPVATDEIAPSVGFNKPRGSFADSVAKETEVTQDVLDPLPLLDGNQPGTPKRI